MLVTFIAITFKSTVIKSTRNRHNSLLFFQRANSVHEFMASGLSLLELAHRKLQFLTLKGPTQSFVNKKEDSLKQKLFC